MAPDLGPTGAPASPRGYKAPNPTSADNPSPPPSPRPRPRAPPTQGPRQKHKAACAPPPPHAPATSIRARRRRPRSCRRCRKGVGRREAEKDLRGGCRSRASCPAVPREEEGARGARQAGPTPGRAHRARGRRPGCAPPRLGPPRPRPPRCSAARFSPPRRPPGFLPGLGAGRGPVGALPSYSGSMAVPGPPGRPGRRGRPLPAARSPRSPTVEPAASPASARGEAKCERHSQAPGPESRLSPRRHPPGA